MRGRINPVLELLAVCIILHGSIDVDGLEVLPESGGESLCYVKRVVSRFGGGYPRSPCA